jgi:hypothetical protein
MTKELVSKLRKSKCPTFVKNFSKTCKGSIDDSCCVNLCSKNCKGINCENVCSELSYPLPSSISKDFKNNCDIKGNNIENVNDCCTTTVNSKYKHYNTEFICNELQKRSLVNNFAVKCEKAGTPEDVYDCCVDNVNSYYPGYEPSSICLNLAYPATTPPPATTLEPSIVADKIERCMSNGFPGRKSCEQNILNCCAKGSDSLLSDMDSMYQCYDGAVKHCKKHHKINYIEGYKYKDKKNKDNCGMWKMIINIALIALLAYLIYLFIGEMGKGDKTLLDENMGTPSAPPALPDFAPSAPPAPPAPSAPPAFAPSA